MSRLPFPAPNLTPVAVTPERLPQPCAREGPFAPNTILQSATRLFEGQVHGSGGRGAWWVDGKVRGHGGHPCHAHAWL